MKIRVGYRDGDNEAAVQELADAKEAVAFVKEAADKYIAILYIETADGKRMGNEALQLLANRT